MTLHSLYICRLTLSCILRETSKATRNANSSLTVFHTAPGLCLTPTGLFCSPLSSAPLRLPSTTHPLWVPLPTGLFSPSSGLVRDLELMPLFGFAPKQTKGSSAWRTTHIVSQLYKCDKDVYVAARPLEGGPAEAGSLSASSQPLPDNAR